MNRILFCLTACILLLSATSDAFAKPRYRMRAKIVGQCDAYFNNYKYGPVQVRDIEDDELCTVKVKAWQITGNKNKRKRVRTPLAGKTFRIYRNDSYSFYTLNTIGEGSTSTSGAVQLPFSFSNDACSFVVDADDSRLGGMEVYLSNQDEACFSPV